jgi:hypothetical protein
MPQDQLMQVLAAELDEMGNRGALKDDENVVVEVLPASGGRGPRFLLAARGTVPSCA